MKKEEAKADDKGGKKDAKAGKKDGKKEKAPEEVKVPFT